MKLAANEVPRSNFRHNLISTFHAIIMSSEYSAFYKLFFFPCFWLRIQTKLFPVHHSIPFQKKNGRFRGILPHNTLINRLLLVTIYINQVCIPLLCILKYPTTSLNLHQPTSMWIFFFSFWYFNGEICYCASKHTHTICWVRGRQFLRTIRFSSGCSVRESHSPPVVKIKKFCPCYSLSLSL